MLLSSEPVALVTTAVCPGVYAIAMLLIIFVLTLIHSAVIPNINSHAFHIIFKPFSFVSSPVEP